MKKFLLALAVLGTVSFATTSCNKNNDDEEGISASIVGTWEAQEANVVVKQGGKEKTIQEFFKGLGLPADDVDDMMEGQDIPGRLEFTSDGKVNAYELYEGKWDNIGYGTYTLKGDQLTIHIIIEDELGEEEEEYYTATVKKLNSSKAEVRIDMTERVQGMIAAMAEEGGAEAAAVVALFKGCSFFADITLKRV